MLYPGPGQPSLACSAGRRGRVQDRNARTSTPRCSRCTTSTRRWKFRRSPRTRRRGRPASACSSRIARRAMARMPAASKGFPNLRDSDWLYGGEPANIVTTITGGRMGVMPGVRPDARRGRRARRSGVRAFAVRTPARLAARAARQADLRAELRRVPRRGRQGQPGARRPEPHRQHLALRQFRGRDRRGHHQGPQRHPDRGCHADAGVRSRAGPGARSSCWRRTSGACRTTATTAAK